MISCPLRMADIETTSVVLPCRMVMPGRGLSLEASRVMAVTLCLRASASSTTRLPILPVDPIRAMAVIVEFPS